jgi:hypothetical protein
MKGPRLLTLEVYCRVLRDAYFGILVRMFITAGRKYFRARIPRTLNFAWGRINITDCLQPQIHNYVSACESIGRRSYAHRPKKRLVNLYQQLIGN